jgi:hypothetical protein
MAPPNQLHAALVSEKMVQSCPDQHSSGLPTKKKKQTLLERITFEFCSKDRSIPSRWLVLTEKENGFVMF